MSNPVKLSLDSIESSKGRRRVAEYLQSQPFPHYEPHPTQTGLLVRIDESGKRTVGHFVKRQFEAVTRSAKSPFTRSSNVITRSSSRSSQKKA